jgi:hypothetical protein
MSVNTITLCISFCHYAAVNQDVIDLMGVDGDEYIYCTIGVFDYI